MILIVGSIIAIILVILNSKSNHSSTVRRVSSNNKDDDYIDNNYEDSTNKKTTNKKKKSKKKENTTNNHQNNNENNNNNNTNIEDSINNESEENTNIEDSINNESEENNLSEYVKKSKKESEEIKELENLAEIIQKNSDFVERIEDKLKPILGSKLSNDSSLKWKNDDQIKTLKKIKKRFNLLKKLLNHINKKLEHIKLENNEETLEKTNIINTINQIKTESKELENKLIKLEEEDEKIIDNKETQNDTTWKELFINHYKFLNEIKSMFIMLVDLSNNLKKINAVHKSETYKEALLLDVSSYDIEERTQPFENLDKWIRRKRVFHLMKEETLSNLIDSFYHILEKERLIKVETDLKTIIVGDTHGDINIIIKIIKKYPPKDHVIIFLGDYVDMGHKSLDNYIYLMLLKLKYPNNIYMVQGNHEVWKHFAFQVADFWFRLAEKNRKITGKLLKLGSFLPYAVLVNDELIGLHAVLPKLKNLNELNSVGAESDEWFALVYGMYFDKTRDEMLGDKDINNIDGEHKGLSQYSREYFLDSIKNTNLKIIAKGHIHGPKGFMYTNEKTFVANIITTKYANYGHMKENDIPGRVVGIYEKGKKFILKDIDTNKEYTKEDNVNEINGYNELIKNQEEQTKKSKEELKRQEEYQKHMETFTSEQKELVEKIKKLSEEEFKEKIKNSSEEEIRNILNLYIEKERNKMIEHFNSIRNQ